MADISLLVVAISRVSRPFQSSLSLKMDAISASKSCFEWALVVRNSRAFHFRRVCPRHAER